MTTSRGKQMSRLFWYISGAFLLMVLFIILLIPALSDGLALDTGIYLLMTFSGMVWFIVFAGKLNKDIMVDEAKAYVVDETTRFIAQWTVPQDLWQRYSQYVYRDSLKSARFAAIAMAVMGTVIALLITLPSMALTDSLGIAGIAAGGAFILVIGIGSLTAQNTLSKNRNMSGADIQFAPNLIVRNGMLIRIEGMGVWLRHFELTEEENIWLLRFSVKNGYASGSKGLRHYTFPVPAAQRATIARLKQQYESLLSLTVAMN